MAWYYRLVNDDIAEVDYETDEAMRDSRNDECNIGEFITFDPVIDKEKYQNLEEVYRDYGVEPCEREDDTIHAMQEAGLRRNEYIYPVSIGEHGRSAFYLGTSGRLIGYCRVRFDKLIDCNIPIRPAGTFEDQLKGELERYEMDYNGSVLMVNIYSKENGYGEIIESQSGYYCDRPDDVIEEYAIGGEYLGMYKDIEECVKDNLEELGVNQQPMFVPDRKKEQQTKKRYIDVDKKILAEYISRQDMYTYAREADSYTGFINDVINAIEAECRKNIADGNEKAAESSALFNEIYSESNVSFEPMRKEIHKLAIERGIIWNQDYTISLQSGERTKSEEYLARLNNIKVLKEEVMRLRAENDNWKCAASVAMKIMANVVPQEYLEKAMKAMKQEDEKSKAEEQFMNGTAFDAASGIEAAKRQAEERDSLSAGSHSQEKEKKEAR